MERTIVFTGGGTGGHVFPGLAVIEYLRSRWDGRIVWIGSGSPMERDIVDRWDIPFYAIPSGKLRRYFSFRNFLDLFRILFGLAAALYLLLRLKPVLVFSKGGYVSVPPVIIARMLGIPVFTHESDLDPGLATRINARFADRIFVAYESTKGCFSARQRGKVVLSGNPVRDEIYRGDRERGRRGLGVPEGVPVLLVLGGSQGSAEINAMIAEVIDALTERFFVVHQTGGEGKGGVPTAQESRTGRYLPVPFLREEYPDTLAAADLVVSRSGAGTLWELAATGRPAVLVPLAGSGTSRGDQVRNARYFCERGAARMPADGERSGPGLLAVIEELVSNEAALASMQAASLAIGRLRASEFIGRSIIDALQEKVWK